MLMGGGGGGGGGGINKAVLWEGITPWRICCVEVIVVDGTSF